MFKNLKFGQRLGLSFGVVLALMFVMAGLSYWGFSSLGQTVSQAFENEARLIDDAGQVRALAMDLRRYEKDVFLSNGNRDKEQEAFNKWNDQKKALTDRLNAIDGYASAREARNAAKVLRDDVATYDAGFNKVVGMYQSGSLRTPQDGVAAMEEFRKPLRSIDDGSRLLVDDAQKRMETRRAALTEGTSNATVNVVAVVLISIAVTVFLVFTIA